MLGAVKEVRAMSRPPSKEPWHAVSVVPGALACPSAVQGKNKRFLAADAPRVPLPDCASPWRCKCIYRHHADRRAGPRRATERGMSGRVVRSDMRCSSGRRAEDTPETSR